MPSFKYSLSLLVPSIPKDEVLKYSVVAMGFLMSLFRLNRIFKNISWNFYFRFFDIFLSLHSIRLIDSLGSVKTLFPTVSGAPSGVELDEEGHSDDGVSWFLAWDCGLCMVSKVSSAAVKDSVPATERVMHKGSFPTSLRQGAQGHEERPGHKDPGLLMGHWKMSPFSLQTEFLYLMQRWVRYVFLFWRTLICFLPSCGPNSRNTI